MKNSWVLLMTSCAAEMLWVMGLKLSNGFTHPVYSIMTGFLIVVSFWLFAKTLKRFSISTGYALYTGIGTVGTTLVGALWLGETLNWSRAGFLALLLFGIVGLKLLSEQKESSVQGGNS